MTVAKTVWGYIQNRDYRVMRRVNRWKAPRWIRYWMIAATRIGDGWLWYSLGIILLMVGGPNRYAAVCAAGSAALATWSRIAGRACSRRTSFHFRLATP
jgi:hypothetical protein